MKRPPIEVHPSAAAEVDPDSIGIHVVADADPTLVDVGDHADALLRRGGPHLQDENARQQDDRQRQRPHAFADGKKCARERREIPANFRAASVE
jgi:hypothetical protein